MTTDAISIDPALEPSGSGASARLLRLTRVRRTPLIAGVVAVALLAGLAYVRTWPPFAVVESGSMAPAINTGDVVLLERLDGRAHVGDIVAVTVPDAARSRYGYPPVVIHRVVRIARNGSLTTKGDARAQPDPFTVRRATAKVLVTIPAAGRAVAFLTSTLGLIWLGAGALLLIVLPMLDRRRAAADAAQDSIAQLHTDVGTLAQELAYVRASAATGATIDAFREEMRHALADLAAALGRAHVVGRAVVGCDRAAWRTLTAAIAALERPRLTEPSGGLPQRLLNALARPRLAIPAQPAANGCDRAAWRTLAIAIAALERPRPAEPTREFPQRLLNALARPPLAIPAQPAANGCDRAAWRTLAIAIAALERPCPAGPHHVLPLRLRSALARLPRASSG